MFNLKSLKTLSLSDNRLAGVPPEGFGQLKKLLVLDLSDNRIQALPVDCGSYGVEELNLNGNQLSEMSPALAAAPRLRVRPSPAPTLRRRMQYFLCTVFD